MMRIYDAQFKGGVFNYSIRDRIEVTKWDFKAGKPKANSSLTKILLEFETDASDYMRLNSRTGYTRESLRDHLNNVSKPQAEEQEDGAAPLTMVESWKSFLDNLKGTCKSKTWCNYENSFLAFQTHMGEAGQLKMFPSRFDLKIYNRWLVYIRERFAPNTQARVTKHFKRFTKSLAKDGIKFGLATEEVKYKEKAGLKIALDDAILNKIYHHKYPKRLDAKRWTFLLQCNTGLRVSDLFRIMENIQGNFIKIETQKVEGDNIEQPITSTVRELLKKLNYKIPEMTEQTYRDAIKEIYKAVDPDSKIQIRDHKSNTFKNVFIHEEISSHDAVRTFITRMFDKGVSPDTIRLMVGKTLEVILKHYLVSNLKKAQAEMLKKFA